MGVYIKGMDMPKCCSECLFRSEFFTDETYGIAYGCNLNISIICNDEYKERKDDCPLVDVPTPHGRLIDEEAVIDHFVSLSNNEWNQNVSTSWANAFAEAASDISDIPTVIEAEE